MLEIKVQTILRGKAYSYSNKNNKKTTSLDDAVSDNKKRLHETKINTRN